MRDEEERGAGVLQCAAAVQRRRVSVVDPEKGAVLLSSVYPLGVPNELKCRLGLIWFTLYDGLKFLFF